MAVETKKMANLAAAGGNFGDQIKSWPERIKTFYNDVRTRNAQSDRALVERSSGHDHGGRHHGCHFCGCTSS